MSLSEYIKHTRHFDGLGMGDQDLEQRAKTLEKRIAELEDSATEVNRRMADLYAVLHQIHEEAHDHSTGPTEVDGYWVIRNLATAALEGKG